MAERRKEAEMGEQARVSRRGLLQASVLGSGTLEAAC